MRWLRLVPAALVFAAPMAAQEFRGTITLRMASGQGGELTNARIYLADGKQAMVTTAPSGPMAGSELRMVSNPATNTLTILMATEMFPGAKGIRMVSQLGGGAASANTGTMTAKALGSSQTIAGMRCEDYEVAAEGRTLRMCMTEGLGAFSMPDMSIAARTPQPPAWAKAFGGRPMFPLKVLSADNQTLMEVTGVERGTPPAAMFDESPEGFVSPPGMPGTRRN